jgi:hypothetical protein
MWMTNAERYLERKALERKTKMWLRIENAMMFLAGAYTIFVVYYLVVMS